MNRLILITIISSILGCTSDVDVDQYNHPIVTDMDNVFWANTINGLDGIDREEMVSNRNQAITNVVIKHLGSMDEVEVVGYLINAGFRVSKRDEDGITNINDGTFRDYRDENSKRSTLRNLQGNHYYYATQDYDPIILGDPDAPIIFFRGNEARIIFELNADEFVRLEAYVVYNSL